MMKTVFFLALAFSFSLTFASLSLRPEEPNPEGFVRCLKSFPGNNDITSQTLTPANASFMPIWESDQLNLMFNKPSTPKPNFIVMPVDETQVRAALLCTKTSGYEIRIRCGGGDFEGLSYRADVPFVMLDLRNMTKIEVDVETQTAWVQGGATLGAVYYEISQKTNTSYFPAGVCGNVGVGGYLSGGGYGNLMRKFGAGSDHVVDASLMDVNGNILDRKSMGEDLFWAIRGGGVSSYGILLAWKLSLVPVPEKVTYLAVNKTLEQGATDIFYKYQSVAPYIDENLMIRVMIYSEFIRGTTKKTIRMLFEGLYLGTIDTLLPLLDDKFPELGVTLEMCEEMKMVQSSLVFADLPSSTQTDILLNRHLFPKLNNKGKSDYVREPIPLSGLEKIWKKIFENDGSEILVLYPFGGRMSEVPDTAIPYPHRAGVLYQMLKTVSFADQPSDTTPTSLRRKQWLQNFQEFMAPYVSKNPREAYSNYNDLDLGVGSATYEEAALWGERYWKKDNFQKLIRIKAQVDPDNFFRHPQSIPVFKEFLSQK